MPNFKTSLIFIFLFNYSILAFSKDTLDPAKEILLEFEELLGESYEIEANALLFQEAQ